MISLLVTISTVFGCGVMPAGRESTRIFNVTGFTLPVSMVYATTTDIQAQIPGIASSKEGAQAFVSRLVMQTVFDVLERQARSALLPDAAISAILGQIEIKITYEPLQCQQFIRNPMDDVDDKKDYCIIVENTVTGICNKKVGGKGACNTDIKDVTAVPSAHLSFSGTLSTTNVIMANWSRMMWQSVVNRAVRRLASRPFGSHFFSAVATISGN